VELCAQQELVGVRLSRKLGSEQQEDRDANEYETLHYFLPTPSRGAFRWRRGACHATQCVAGQGAEEKHPCGRLTLAWKGSQQNCVPRFQRVTHSVKSFDSDKRAGLYFAGRKRKSGLPAPNSGSTECEYESQDRPCSFWELRTIIGRRWPLG